MRADSNRPYTRETAGERKPMAEPAERIPARRVATITGMKIRTVQMRAARGEIPSAVRYGGPGSHWYFDEAAIRRWIVELEAVAANERADIPFRPRLDGGQWLSQRQVDKAYEHIIGRRRTRRRRDEQA